MQEGTASVQFDGYETEVQALTIAGLAQGSPLSPILFAFYNADLIDQAVDTQHGASACIDDYFLWRIGKSAEENLDKIRHEDIPRITAWAERTGAYFVPAKTELIHHTRRRKGRGKGLIIMDGQTVKAPETAKLLRVIFDTEMRWKAHVQHATKKATTTALGMSGLRHLRPAQMRQIYQACVLPKLDYASTIYHNPLRDKGHLRVLRTVQRAALPRIISTLRTVATQALAVECHVLPMHLRLKHRGRDVIARLCTLPQDHPPPKVMERVKRRITRQGSQPRLAIAETAKTMDIEAMETLEIIDPTPPPPWTRPTFDKVTITNDKLQAQDEADELAEKGEILIYTDASAKDGTVGAAVVMYPETQQQRTRQPGVRLASKWTVHVAELIAISQAVGMIEEDSKGEAAGREKAITIVSDSQAAIQALANPKAKSGPAIVHDILQKVQTLQGRRIKVRLRWVPSPGGNEGNQLAKKAVSSTEGHGFRSLLSTFRRLQHKKIEEEWRQEWNAAVHSRHLKRIDHDQPAKRALHIYGTLTRHQTYLLAQLRTGHSWLATYAMNRRFTEDARCACGATETVVHVMVDCSQLRVARQKLRNKVGDASNSIASLLGGQSRNEQGKTNNGA